MANHKFRGRIVYDPREIPSDWVRLANLNNRADGEDTDEYKAAYRACCTGDIPADKCLKYQTTPHDKRGPIYADPECLDRAIAASKAKNFAKSEIADLMPKLASGFDISRLLEAAERIADALELIATHPKSGAHTPYGQHLHASTNGDR